MKAVEQASAENLLGGFIVVGGHVGFDILLPVFGGRGESGEQILVDWGGLIDGEQEGLVGEDLGGPDIVDVAAIAMGGASSGILHENGDDLTIKVLRVCRTWLGSLDPICLLVLL